MRLTGHRAPPPEDQPLVRKLASVLLRYPDEGMLALLDDVRAAAASLGDERQREPLRGVADQVHEAGTIAAAQTYVATFDLTRRCSPYLTYYRYGDTRNRGVALLALKEAYRRGGELRDGELGDHLPTMLEFAALAPEQGEALLLSHRPELELLRWALRDAESGYVPVLDAVCEGLPGLSDRQLDRVRRWVENGPPGEDVGLDPVGSEPFAPPEYLTGVAQEGLR
jgi:nitrate reductase delta subunit